jgi:hypothetical protein
MGIAVALFIVVTILLDGLYSSPQGSLCETFFQIKPLSSTGFHFQLNFIKLFFLKKTQKKKQ